MSQETLIQHYQLKLNILQFLQYPPYEPIKSEQIEFRYETMKRGDIECSVLIEFDTKHPASGIYYGCKVSSKSTTRKIDKQWETIIKNIKNDFGIYWNDFSKAYSRILPCGHEDRNAYWPFWIRLNDDEDIREAVNGVQIIIRSLLNQEFSFC